MFVESADIYDLIYSFKDYKKEAGDIVKAIKVESPGCKTVLDVACGTAEHHKYLRDVFTMEGLDLSEDFVKAARQKNPSCAYYLADMCGFNLKKEYDAVICLFSSIGYAKTYDKMVDALKCFKAHMKDHAILMLEPWFRPDTWHNGRLHMITCDREDIKVSRLNLSAQEGSISVLNLHYLLGTPDKGVRHFVERHELGLFTKEEMMQALDDAGLAARYEEPGLMGRGMYYAKKKSS